MSIRCFLAAFAALFVSSAGAQTAQTLSDAIAKPAQQRSDGPAIDHYFMRSGKVEIEKALFPEAAPGQKIVVLRLPEADGGRIDLDQYQVGVTFTTKRISDPCNTTRIQGEITESAMFMTSTVRYYRLQYDRSRTSQTLRACTRGDKQMRDVEIVTTLKQLQPFSDNLVFYVPEDVDVSAQIWQRARVIQGVAP